MSYSADDRAKLQDAFARLKCGDRSAVNDLFKAAEKRFYAIARDYLGKFPHARRWMNSTDVVQEVILKKIFPTLQNKGFQSLDHFIRFSKIAFLHGLIELMRHYRARPDQEKHVTPKNKQKKKGASSGRGGLVNPIDDVADRTPNPAKQAEVAELLEETLSKLVTENQLRVFLLRLEGRKPSEIAEMLLMDGRTERRHYRDACKALRPYFSEYIES